MKKNMENSIFGGLLSFETTEQFHSFIDTIDKTTALKLIELSIEYGQENGFYSLKESFCLYKCITNLKE